MPAKVDRNKRDVSSKQRDVAPKKKDKAPAPGTKTVNSKQRKDTDRSGGLVGSDGKSIRARVRNGKIRLSGNASDNIKAISKMINESGSKTARKQFMRLSKSEGKVNFRISKEHNTVAHGMHQPHDISGNILNWDKEKGIFDGSPAVSVDSKGDRYYKEATITLFEPNHERLALVKGLSKEQAMVITFAHEVDHNLNQLAIQAVMDRDRGIENNYDVEAPAEKVEAQVEKEIRAHLDSTRTRPPESAGSLFGLGL